jgi:hypothetical protein
MAEFGPDSTVREILEQRPDAWKLLLAHGYAVGEGFVDILSQYQTLSDAARGGRIRDVEGLLRALNHSQPT